ncbi:transposase [Actinomyces ruminicola]|uniref:transposase n=1 Tax=Actinomyces ruminicola TaxID=332524 RepID=UPI000B80336A
MGGPRAGTAGRGAAGRTLVAGAIEVGERGWGRCRLMVISDASKTSLRQFVTTTVRAGATVVTDAYPERIRPYL